MDARVTSFAAADAKAKFSQLLSRAEAGEEIVISRHGAPVAKLVPVRSRGTIAERRARADAYIEQVQREGMTLGPDLTLKQLINEGRRY
jgi:prevent-host-death family protein